MIKWKSDKQVNQENSITNITISKIVNYPIKNETDRPSRQFSFIRPMKSNFDSEIRCYRYNQEKDSGEPNGKYTLNTRYRKDAEKSIEFKKM